MFSEKKRHIFFIKFTQKRKKKNHLTLETVTFQTGIDSYSNLMNDLARLDKQALQVLLHGIILCFIKIFMLEKNLGYDFPFPFSCVRY